MLTFTILLTVSSFSSNSSYHVNFHNISDCFLQQLPQVALLCGKMERHLPEMVYDDMSKQWSLKAVDFSYCFGLRITSVPVLLDGCTLVPKYIPLHLTPKIFDVNILTSKLLTLRDWYVLYNTLVLADGH